MKKTKRRSVDVVREDMEVFEIRTEITEDRVRQKMDTLKIKNR